MCLVDHEEENSSNDHSWLNDEELQATGNCSLCYRHLHQVCMARIAHDSAQDSLGLLKKIGLSSKV